ncbi:transportin-SR [Aphelenchoides avenae]|nr:transportin-SR [Aphelenchus avenae]
MEMQPDIEHVYQAVALMNGQDPVQSTNAAQFLGEFQKSVYAWSISDQILQQARSADACVFAGQAMRQKVLHDFRELPKESYAQLRDSLLSHLSHIEAKLPQKSSTVVTQLAATLADLYLQVPEWNDFITHMLAKLNQNTGSNASVLLSVFKVFPEELQNRHLKIGDNRRKTVEKELADQTSAVVHYLSRICHDNPADKAIQLKVISCLGSWLLNKECPTDELAQSPLVHYVLQLLQAPECPLDVCEAVCDCITSALYLVEDTRRHYQLAKVLQEGIYGSVGAFHAAETAEDLDKLQALSRVYTELNESLLESVMNEPGTGLGDLRSVDLLLVVAAHHDYSLVEMTFNVWYRLSEFLYQAPDDTFQELKNVFRPYVER